MSKSLRC